MTDFTCVLKDADGTALLDEMAMKTNGGVRVELTLGHAVGHALFASYSDEQNIDGEEKWKRAQLGVRVRDAKKATCTAEEIALLKKMIAKLYGPIVVYRAWMLMDPALA